MYLVNLNDDLEIGVELRELSRGRWLAETHDGGKVELALKGRDADGLFVFNVDGEERLIKIEPGHVTVLNHAGDRVPIEVTAAADVVLDDMGKRTPEVNLADELKSPITGIVLEILVSAGDEIKSGDPLVVVEAMKMENSLGAPRDGVVAEIVVEPGTTVFVDDVLVRLEPQ